jgi:pre-peptidase
LPLVGGGTYEATFEDWYEVTLATGATMNVSLEFDGTGADIDMYLFSILDQSTAATHTKSTDDNIATETYAEEMSTYLSAGTYYVAIDAYLTPVGRADYSLTISFPDGYIDVCDWFSFSLVSEAQVTITVTGGPNFVLMDNAGANALASGGEQDTSITLSAGSYLIGVSEGGEYTLDVTSP